MDGLLANLYDFVGMKIYGKLHEEVTKEEFDAARTIWTDKEQFYAHLGGVYEVFANLPAFNTNHELLEFITFNFGNFKICSHPSNLDRDACIRGKEEWIKKHIIESYHGDRYCGALFPQHKADHALNEDGSPNILIDDWQPYVDDWNNAGGIAIKLQSAKFKPYTGELSEYLIKEFAKFGIKTSTTGILGLTPA